MTDHPCLCPDFWDLAEDGSYTPVPCADTMTQEDGLCDHCRSNCHQPTGVNR